MITKHEKFKAEPIKEDNKEDKKWLKDRLDYDTFFPLDRKSMHYKKGYEKAVQDALCILRERFKEE